MTLRAPFPWFGGKRRVAHLVWERFGDVPNYVEPFAGSLAVLLGRPHEARVETVNDLDCYVANFWRALQAMPEELARYADHPVNEADLHARHTWLVNRPLWREAMKSDPDHFDVKIAGWWVWGISQWIGSGWCRNPEWRGRWSAGMIADRGVHAQHVSRQIPCLHGDSGATGRGVHASSLARKMPKADRGTASRMQPAERSGLYVWLADLADRMRRVRVCCGDWKRILGPSPTTCIGTTAVFLDPPYGGDRAECYSVDDFDVAKEVTEWCVVNGDNPDLRIALCGYDGEHNVLESKGWEVVPWKASGGYARGGKALLNGDKERIWFSPPCLKPSAVVALGTQESLFTTLEATP
jgi:DNA adenine methylase